MRTIVFAGLALLSAFSPASANSVIMIDIKTTPAAVAYSLNSQPMTPTQLAEWMKNALEAFGDKEPILIQPDSQTTFATVFALLERLKASGVKHFEVITELSKTPAGFSKRYLVSDAEDLKHTKLPPIEPPK